MDRMPGTTDFTVNGRQVHVSAPQTARLSQVLREKLGLTGTKVGCDAGDCGACTVLLDGAPACSCMIALGQPMARSADHRDSRKLGGDRRCGFPAPRRGVRHPHARHAGGGDGF
jgi:hypothetical protein